MELRVSGEERRERRKEKRGEKKKRKGEREEEREKVIQIPCITRYAVTVWLMASVDTLKSLASSGMAGK